MPKSKQFPVVDIEEEIEKYAWKQYMKERKLAKYFLRRKNYYVDIKWGFVEFTHKTTHFEPRPEKTDGAENIDPEDLPDPTMREDTPEGVPKISKKFSPVTLYKSEFENKTQEEQQYSFNTSRETTASASVSFQESFTKGAECNIEIGVKDIVKVGAGLSGQVSVTNSNGQTFEEKMNWVIDTNIKVAAGHRAEAIVKVSERTITYDFTVKTTVSILGGKELPVAVRRRSDDQIVCLVQILDFKPVFHELAKIKPDIVELKKVKREGDLMDKFDIVLTTNGTFKEESWKNQQVEVESKKIDGFVVEKKDCDSGEGKDGGSS